MGSDDCVCVAGLGIAGVGDGYHGLCVWEWGSKVKYSRLCFINKKVEGFVVGCEGVGPRF